MDTSGLGSWWAALSDEARRLFLDHVDDDPIPTVVAVEFARSGRLIRGWYRPRRPVAFSWPPDVRRFLEQQLRDDDRY